MNFPTPFDRHSERVRSEWIDFNGHMNVAYYVVVFDNAVDVLFEALGYGRDWREAAGRSHFAVEAHIRYLGEVKLGTLVAVESRMLGADAKRLHHFHIMRNAETGAVAATFEVLSLTVDMTTRKAGSLAPADLQRALDAVAAHATLPLPDGVGRAVAMKR